tara:strand:+ start:1723 stop:2136 length:414 start_codon:yes stop_codon:yes gene_type:complete
MPYSMRKRIKAVSDSSDNYSDSDDEDYVPVSSGVSLKELNKNLIGNGMSQKELNKNLKEFNKNFNKTTFWTNLMWYIKWVIIFFSQMVIAIYCCHYLYNIIKPHCINFFTIFVVLLSITIISTIQISIQHYYKKMIE